ncbi:hypothetical protein N9A28_09810 [Sulfurimonas sp.]|nr:hypothetical protein [Sulfurimonas sp.]
MNSNHKLDYHFTPAALISNFVPLIVILDDEAPNFEYKMWNVLTPIIDSNDIDSDLLQDLINEMAEEYECEDHIYIYAKGRWADTAILHASLCNANAVYVDTTQIKQVAKDYEPILYVHNEEHTLKEVLDMLERMKPN